MSTDAGCCVVEGSRKEQWERVSVIPGSLGNVRLWWTDTDDRILTGGNRDWWAMGTTGGEVKKAATQAPTTNSNQPKAAKQAKKKSRQNPSAGFNR